MLRKIVAVILALIFIPVFVFSLFLYRVNSTVMEPDFYTSTLREANVYSYIHTSVLPAAIDGTKDKTLTALKPAVLQIARETLPPEWLQTQTEALIRNSVPYITGDIRSFRTVIPVKDRIDALGAAVKSTFSNTATSAIIYDMALQTMLAQTGNITLPVSVNMTGIMIQAFPPQWVSTQVNTAVDATLPYLKGETEHFTVTIRLADRLDATQTAMVDAFKSQQMYDYVVKQYMVPLVRQNLNKLFLPASLVFSDADLTNLVTNACPLSWYQAQVPNLVGQMFEYVRGSRPTLDLSISLADQKSAIAAAGVKMINEKLGMNLINDGSMLNNLIPNSVSFSDPTITAAATQFKSIFQKGFTFTDADLVNALGSAAGNLNTLRQATGEGFVITQAELRTGLGSANVDNLRSSLSSFRSAKYYLWVIPLLLLAAAGFVASRRLGTKLIWAGGTLAVGALIALIIYGPILSGVVQPQLNGMLMQTAQLTPGGISSGIAFKAIEIADRFLSAFSGGLVTQSIIFLMVGVVAAAAGLMLNLRKKG